MVAGYPVVRLWSTAFGAALWDGYALASSSLLLPSFRVHQDTNRISHPLLSSTELPDFS